MADKQQLRVGKISSINYPDGTARVTFDDKDGSTTPEIPFFSWDYWMPKIGDQVIVAHFSNGTSRAMILGPFWYDGHRPAEGYEGLYRDQYSNDTGKAYEKYDSKAEKYDEMVTGQIAIEATEKWTLTVGACTIEVTKDGKVTITAPDSVTINTPTVTVTGDVIASGVSLVHHTHTGDSGGSTSEPKK